MGEVALELNQKPGCGVHPGFVLVTPILPKRSTTPIEGYVTVSLLDQIRVEGVRLLSCWVHQ